MAGTVQGTLYNFIHLDVTAALGSRYNGYPQLIDWETEAQIIVLGSSRARFKPKLSDLLPQLPPTREKFQVFALQGNVTESKHWGMRALILTSTDYTGQLIGFIELLFLYLEKGVPHFSSNLTTVILTVALEHLPGTSWPSTNMRP